MPTPEVDRSFLDDEDDEAGESEDEKAIDKVFTGIGEGESLNGWFSERQLDQIADRVGEFLNSSTSVNQWQERLDAVLEHFPVDYDDPGQEAEFTRTLLRIGFQKRLEGRER